MLHTRNHLNHNRITKGRLLQKFQESALTRRSVYSVYLSLFHEVYINNNCIFSDDNIDN